MDDDREEETHHPQVLVRCGDHEAEVDEEIAPLIRELWAAGIETTMSCQEDGWGFVWVEFPLEDDLSAFINIVIRYEPGPGTLYRRALHRLTEEILPCWRLEIFPYDLNLHNEEGEETEWHEGRPAILFAYSVRFPPADLPVVLRRLRRYNRPPRPSAGPHLFPGE